MCIKIDNKRLSNELNTFKNVVYGWFCCEFHHMAVIETNFLLVFVHMADFEIGSVIYIASFKTIIEIKIKHYIYLTFKSISKQHLT